MKNNIIVQTVLFSAVLLLAACQSGKNIEVDIKNVPAQKVRLEEIKGSEFIFVDSTSIEAGKPFTLSADLSQEKMYRLFFEQEKYVMLALEKGDKLKVTGNWGQLENYRVAGSQKSEIVKQLVAGTRQSIIDIRTYQMIFDSLEAKGQTEKLAEAKKDYQINNVRFVNYLKQYADTTNSAVAALMAVNIINPKLEAPFVVQFYDKIDKRFKKNDLVTLYKERFVGSPGISTAPVNTDKGTPAPDFFGQTPDGKTVKLSDYSGKYVLVDFWASWCGPCRKENPAVVKAYEAMKGKKFDILGVSLDTDKNNWKAAIAKDKLTWKHISALKGWSDPVAAKYNVKSIPANFLISPEGYVVAQNLRGQELLNKLNELIKE